MLLQRASSTPPTYGRLRRRGVPRCLWRSAEDATEKGVLNFDELPLLKEMQKAPPPVKPDLTGWEKVAPKSPRSPKVRLPDRQEIEEAVETATTRAMENTSRKHHGAQRSGL